MSTYTVAGVTKTTVKDAGFIVVAMLEGKTVSSLTRDEETLKQTIYDIKRLGWTNEVVLPFIDGAEYGCKPGWADVPSFETVDLAQVAEQVAEIATKDDRRVYNLEIVSSGLGDSIGVHRAGCRDCRKAEARGDSVWMVEAQSMKDVVLDSFGPAAGSFFEEAGFTAGTPEYDAAWESYVGEFKVYACVAKGLPQE